MIYKTKYTLKVRKKMISAYHIRPPTFLHRMNWVVLFAHTGSKTIWETQNTFYFPFPPETYVLLILLRVKNRK